MFLAKTKSANLNWSKGIEDGLVLKSSSIGQNAIKLAVKVANSAIVERSHLCLQA